MFHRLLPLSLLAVTACTGELITEDLTDWQQAAAEELEDSTRTPEELMAFAYDYEPRPVPSYEDARAALETDPSMAPLREALTAGGLDEEEAALLVYGASGHNSGQPWDPVRQRADEFRESLHATVDEFNVQLAEAEAREGVTVDRKTLTDRGVILNWERSPR